MDLERNESKGYNPHNMDIISKDLLDEIHDQNMKRNITMINKEEYLFGFLFIGDSATISQTPFPNILVSGNNTPVEVLYLVDSQGHLADGGEKDG